MARTSHRRARSPGAWAAALLGASAVSCTQHTQLVVAVDTDLSVPDEVDRFTVEIVSDTVRAPIATADVSHTGAALPQTLGLAPANDGVTDAAFTVRATAYHGADLVVQRDVATRFTAGATQLLQVGLYAHCRGVTCAAQQSCGQQGCAPVAAGTLPAWTGSVPERPTEPLFLGGLFPIAVHLQPSENFQTWLARGVNTVRDVPDGRTVAEWSSAAIALGLFVMRDASSASSADVGNGNLLAWTRPGSQEDGWPGNATDYQRTYDMLHAIDPSRPLMTPFNPDKVSNTGDGCDGPGDATSAASCYPALIAGTDWIEIGPHPIASDDATNLAVYGQVIDRVESWSDARPVIASIEAGTGQLPLPQSASARAPTADEMRAEIWDAVIHGARGVSYFPVQFQHGGSTDFQFDTTTTELQAEITRQNALLTQLGAVLQGRIDPPEVTASAPAPFEIGWRRAGRTTYVFALYLPPCDVSLPGGCPAADGTITLTGPTPPASAEVLGESRTVPIAGGTITDHFAADALHVYVLR